MSGLQPWSDDHRRRPRFERTVSIARETHAYAIQASVEESYEAAAAATEWWLACNETDKNAEAREPRITRAASAFARLVYHLIQAIINGLGAIADAIGMKNSMKRLPGGGAGGGEAPTPRGTGKEPTPAGTHDSSPSHSTPTESTGGAAKSGPHATAEPITTPTNSELTSLGSAPSGKGQLTKAGHSLSKHGAGERPGSSVFPDPTGTPASLTNKRNSCLSDSARVVKQRSGRPGEHLLQISRPDGSGAIFKWDGSQWSFSHFAENLF